MTGVYFFTLKAANAGIYLKYNLYSCHPLEVCISVCFYLSNLLFPIYVLTVCLSQNSGHGFSLSVNSYLVLRFFFPAFVTCVIYVGACLVFCFIFFSSPGLVLPHFLPL